MQLIAEPRGTEHVVLNASKVVLADRDERIADIVRKADLVNADGQSVVWAGRLLGLAVPERVTGIDLMEHLLERAESSGTTVYFLGATAEVLRRFLDVVKERFSDLVIAGAADGYFSDDAEAAARVARSGAQLLFVAMPSPRKEFFIAENLHLMGPLLAVGVGGSFDVWAGEVTRAPQWMRSSGLEWFYRFIQEPGRMWKRYLVGNFRFAVIVVRALFSAGRAR
jgi:N-acetylglucosaminyldiphosphoundecaprenol N-acetyl-beta-D-mannosaminyltransferase